MPKPPEDPNVRIVYVNAGRPPLFDGAMSRISITLPDSFIELLRCHGEGNVSEGVRRLVQEHLVDSLQG